MEVQIVGSKVHTVVPLERPRRKGKLNEVLMLTERFVYLLCQQGEEIHDASLPVAKGKQHGIVVKVLNVFHGDEVKVFVHDDYLFKSSHLIYYIDGTAQT